MIDEFIKLLSNYEHEAFRLETLPVYDVSYERENFDHFLETGEAIQNDDLKEYIAEHASHIASGKRHIRARVVPQPMIDYVIYETKIGYISQHEAGFEHYFIDAENYNKLNIETKDFWLFDKKDLVYMKYDTDGKFLGVDIVDNKEAIDQSLALRKVFLENGYGLDNLLDHLQNSQKSL